MAKKKKKNVRSDSLPKASTGVAFLTTQDAYDMLCVKGYTSLDKIPAIVAGYRRIAELIGSMTIHLMANTSNGDQRIVNQLSRKIDIDPCRTMNRSTWMEYIVMEMLLYGKGNAIVKVQTRNGHLDNLQPIPNGRFQLLSDATGYDYLVKIDGINFNHDDVLHFVYNPDKNYPWRGMGVTASLQDVAQCLRQSQRTEQAFLESPKPSLIVKVDGINENFANRAGREKLLDEYIYMSDAGKPWVIPADQIDVKEVRPLSLSDIAIKDTIELDTKKVASVLGVPSFVLGVGTYNQQEWNNFISTKVKPIALIIQQELTRKLILKPEWYLKLNTMSLFDYDIEKVASVYTTLQDRGDVTGNEVRDRLGLSPREGLDELKILENYIPTDMSGLQKKLLQEDE